MLSLAVSAETLRFSYWIEAAPPLAFKEEGRLVGGIIKQIGDAIGEQMDVPVEYVELPVPRIEPYLLDGQIDIDCITNPAWKHDPSKLDWSPALFDGADRFIVRSGKDSSIDQFTDLKGRTLGIYNGYIYHPEIMRMIEEKEVSVVKVSDVTKALHLLEMKRIDALIDFGVILRYQLQQFNQSGAFALANKAADSYQLFCAYSPKLAIGDQGSEAFDTVIESLVSSGKIDAILKQYE